MATVASPFANLATYSSGVANQAVGGLTGAANQAVGGLTGAVNQTVGGLTGAANSLTGGATGALTGYNPAAASLNTASINPAGYGAASYPSAVAALDPVVATTTTATTTGTTAPLIAGAVAEHRNAGNIPRQYLTYGLLSRRRQRRIDASLGLTPQNNRAAAATKVAAATTNATKSAVVATAAGCRLPAAATTTGAVAGPTNGLLTATPAGACAAASYTAAVLSEPCAAAGYQTTEAYMPLTNAAVWSASTAIISTSQYIDKALSECNHKKIKHYLCKAQENLERGARYLVNIPAAACLSAQYALVVAELSQITKHVPKKHISAYQQTVILGFQGQLAALYNQLNSIAY